MYKAQEIADIFETIAPKNTGVPGDELGFLYGDPNSEVTGLACMWNVHSKSIQSCVAKKINMVITHEALFLPPQNSPWYEGPKESEIYSNKVRKNLLDQSSIVVYRSHSNWDALKDDGVADQAVKALGIPGLKCKVRKQFFSIQELPEKVSIIELREYINKGLNFYQSRIFGDPEKRIRTFAFLIGGFGENQFHLPQVARDLGAEAIVMGEMSEFILISCLEMDLPVIESLHSVSEIPAIKKQAVILKEKLPDLHVHYIPSGAMAFHKGSF